MLKKKKKKKKKDLLRLTKLDANILCIDCIGKQFHEFIYLNNFSLQKIVQTSGQNVVEIHKQ